MNLVDNIEKEETLSEVAYKYNVGFEEMVRFYQQGSPNDIKKMEKFIKSDSWIGFKRLIKKVLGVDLKG